MQTSRVFPLFVERYAYKLRYAAPFIQQFRRQSCRRNLEVISYGTCSHIESINPLSEIHINLENYLTTCISDRKVEGERQNNALNRMLSPFLLLMYWWPDSFLIYPNNSFTLINMWLNFAWFLNNTIDIKFVVVPVNNIKYQQLEIYNINLSLATIFDCGMVTKELAVSGRISGFVRGGELLNIVSRVISRWRSRNNDDQDYSIKHGDRLDRIDERSPGVMPAAGHGSRIDLINRKPNAVQPNKPELPVLGVGSTGVSRARLLGNNANLNWSGRCVVA